MCRGLIEELWIRGFLKNEGQLDQTVDPQLHLRTIPDIQEMVDISRKKSLTNKLC